MNDLVTREQFIKEAKGQYSAAIERAENFKLDIESRTRLAQTSALIAIADALDKLLLNGIIVEKP